MRHQTAASEVNKELNSSEFNISVDENPIEEKPLKDVVKSEVGNRMSKILAEFDNEDPDE